MDLTVLAADVAAAVAPFVPALTKMVEKSSEEFAKRIGGDSWDGIKSLWTRLGRDDPGSLVQSAMELAAQPEDTDAYSAFRFQVAQRLRGDSDLREVCQRFLDEMPSGDRPVAISVGERSVAIAGEATGNAIVTGDHARASTFRDHAGASRKP